jgi:hypothetical protein
MPFQVSPNVLVQERDVSLFVPQVATTAGAFVGHFNWGPAKQFVTVDSEKTLYNIFGKPDDNNFKYWYTAANFLSYGNNLQINRLVDTGALNASAAGSAVQIANDDHYDGVNGYSAPTLTSTEYVGRYPGALGNNLKISACDNNSYSFNVTLASVTSVYTTGASVTATSRPIPKGSWIEITYNSVNYRFQTTADAATGATTLAFVNTAIATASTTTATALWEFWQNVASRPGTSRFAQTKAATTSGTTIYDELHVIVVDEDGAISGVANTILEIHQGLSKASDAKSTDGTSLYYKNYLNLNSQYIRWGSAPAAGYLTSSVGQSLAWGSASPTSGGFNTMTYVQSRSLSGGVDATPTDALMQVEYLKLANAELYDVSLIPVVGVTADNATAAYVVDNVAESRRDCMVFVSPTTSAKNTGDLVVADRTANFNKDSTFAVMDSSWKYQYDRYNDVYRYVPMAGDTAGICVRTDSIAEPWYSPGGYTRGQVKNLVKLNWTPGKTDRDNLYRYQINPVVTQPGLGTVLFGDKTLTQKPSAFDRINVRRLFIVLEKAIATAAKFQLFEFNDGFTRSQFVSLVEPFLRDVQGRRGIYDFKVVCDETNNTGEVVDRNEFVADIYIKPAKSINFITLNFVATRTGISFEEVGA